MSACFCTRTSNTACPRTCALVRRLKAVSHARSHQLPHTEPALATCHDLYCECAQSARNSAVVRTCPCVTTEALRSTVHPTSTSNPSACTSGVVCRGSAAHPCACARTSVSSPCFHVGMCVVACQRTHVALGRLKMTSQAGIREFPHA